MRVPPRTSLAQEERMPKGPVPDSIVCDMDMLISFEQKIDFLEAGRSVRSGSIEGPREPTGYRLFANVVQGPSVPNCQACDLGLREWNFMEFFPETVALLFIKLNNLFTVLDILLAMRLKSHQKVATKLCNAAV